VIQMKMEMILTLDNGTQHKIIIVDFTNYPALEFGVSVAMDKIKAVMENSTNDKQLA